jgi:pyruvate dehydrogenase E1 component alpha subunit/2-oxoisovalerate dehydrogenase E1 component alpha subunit
VNRAAAASPTELVPALPIYGIVAPDGTLAGKMPEVSDDTLRAMYETMLLIRLLDERMMILQRQGRVGFYGACTGQEAVGVATAAALEASDWIFPALREGGALLHRGLALELYLAQVFGSAADVSRGRQMPSHMANREYNVVSWSSCIATQLPQAVGAAWAAKIRREPVVTVGFMGDGATSEADFHYALNFAGVYRVPCVLICQNNHWSISVPTERQTHARTIAEKAYAYGIPCARVDGNDAIAVWSAVREAAERARSDGGPTFLEMLTYRIGAHSSSDDPRVYRDEREVDLWKTRDPIARFKTFLIGRGAWSEAREAETRAKLEERIGAAIAMAVKAPPPE